MLLVEVIKYVTFFSLLFLFEVILNYIQVRLPNQVSLRLLVDYVWLFICIFKLDYSLITRSVKGCWCKTCGQF